MLLKIKLALKSPPMGTICLAKVIRRSSATAGGKAGGAHVFVPTVPGHVDVVHAVDQVRKSPHQASPDRGVDEVSGLSSWFG